ncbi:MAG TPA: hypothetical protein VIF15_17805 [Polyangiaceae bacterium]|jgi:hypothetical protein
MATPLPLDRVTSLAVDPGARVVVRGLATTSVDGSSFDAAMQWDALSPGAVRPGGLFDLEAGGLRVVEQHPERHQYVLTSTGSAGPACLAAHAESPCLVPRLATLAHERLRTQGELASTLTGGVEVEGVLAPPPGSPGAETVSGLTLVAVLFGLALAVGLLLGWARRRARTALGRVRAAARDAMRTLRGGDPTLDRVRVQVRAMVARAKDLEAARRACAQRLRRIDRAALERRREAHARSVAPEAADTLAWLTAECSEASRLESDLSSSILGLQRIESALRVVALRVREHHGTRARVAHGDPVDVAADELHLRDEALSEADRAIAT